MKITLRFLLTVFLLVSAFASFSAIAQQKRGPSTPEERKKMAQMITSLENDPISKDAKSYRKMVFAWASEVPDISVTLCPGVLNELPDSKKEYAGELFLQSTFSSIKFIIENPDKANDQLSVYQGGVEGTLRAYTALRQKNPKVQFESLDQLLEKQKNGSLTEYIKTATNGKGCGK